MNFDTLGIGANTMLQVPLMPTRMEPKWPASLAHVSLPVVIAKAMGKTLSVTTGGVWCKRASSGKTALHKVSNSDAASGPSLFWARRPGSFRAMSALYFSMREALADTNFEPCSKA